MKYYLWINENQEGPYEDWEILKKLTAKVIPEGTLACEDGAPEPKWIKVTEIPAIRWSSNFAPKPSPSFGGFESSIDYFSSAFGRVYLLLGIIGSIFTILTGQVVFGFVGLFGTVAVSVFFLGLGEIIRTLHSIRDELKNQRRP